MANKKIVLKVDLHDERIKQKAMKTVSGITGVQSISMEKEEGKMTVIAAADPVCIVTKLRKHCHAEVASVEPEKKDKSETEKPKPPEDTALDELVRRYVECHPCVNTYYCYRVDENPNLCVIL